MFVSIGETKVTDYLFTDKNIKTMIMRNINTDLIDAMKIYLPKGNNLANALMDILYLGKEATYRRLRGEVPKLLN